MATPRPRVINLSKHEGHSFGFYLRAEQGEEGHLIRNLEMGGPAELAGLKDGDRILRVNGTFVDNMEHSQVVEMVKASGMTVTFHVLDQASYKQAKASGTDLSNPQSRPAQTQPVMNGVAGTVPKPKLCFLVKSKSGYGFSLKSTRGEQGVFMTDVTPAGVAERAGVKTRDRVLEINSENVESATHEQMVEKIKASGNSVMFLLADEDTDRYYRNKKLKMGVEMATVKHLPHKPRIADMTKGSDGYGYFLRADPNLEGHVIKDIDRGSPAEGVGLKDMDRLVAVNGEEVDFLSHDQVVDRIRQCGDTCSLLVVDVETDKMYKMGGASPLLYWEEMRGSLPQPSPPASPKPATSAPEPSPAPPLAQAQPVTADYKPKLCKLEKTSSGYGFHLNGIQGVPGQYIKEVVKGGAADRAGLEDDDIVIEVNGVNVEDSTHEQVVDMIRSSGNSLVLLVAEKRAYEHFKAKQIPITTLLLAEASPAVPAVLEEVKEEEESEHVEDKAEDGREEEKAEDRQEEVEQREEIAENRQEEEVQEKEEARPATPPSQPESSDRKASVSSASSSCNSEDERL